jgi:hypothetical protein
MQSIELGHRGLVALGDQAQECDLVATPAGCRRGICDMGSVPREADLWWSVRGGVG